MHDGRHMRHRHTLERVRHGSAHEVRVLSLAAQDYAQSDQGIRASVPQHADINYHWHYRVRLHIPVVTHPAVRFFCDDQSVHMAAGEAWVFDNWRLHRVEHSTPDERIHLVADTTGTAAFWQFVVGSQRPGIIDQSRVYDPGRDAAPLTETFLPAVVMHPAEVELLLLDFRSELVAGGESAAGDRWPGGAG